MAVYTPLTVSDIEPFLATYTIGQLKDFGGIESGVENTNYWLETTEGKFILTLYEKRVDKNALPFYLDLQFHLASKGLPCPLPVKNNQGNTLTSLKEKPAAIVTFLTGKSARLIQNAHMPLLGKAIATMHLHTADLSTLAPENHFSLDGWQKMARDLAQKPEQIKSGLTHEISTQLEWLAENWPKQLPSGIIHGDLFPDNVFFKQDTLTGIIDFYFACHDFWMYDLAIVLNAWCFEHEREFNMTKARLFLSAYNEVRPITEAEWHALPILSSGAAMRFLLTRTHDWCNPVADALVKPKDPLEYLHKLRFHQGIQSHKEYAV